MKRKGAAIFFAGVMACMAGTVSYVVITHGGWKSGGGSTGSMGNPLYIGTGMRDSIVSMTNEEER